MPGACTGMEAHWGVSRGGARDESTAGFVSRGGVSIVGNLGACPGAELEMEVCLRMCLGEPRLKVCLGTCLEMELRI